MKKEADEPIAVIEVASPSIYLKDVQVGWGTTLSYWHLSRQEAAELRDLLDGAIREFDKRFGMP